MAEGEEGHGTHNDTEMDDDDNENDDDDDDNDDDIIFLFHYKKTRFESTQNQLFLAGFNRFGITTSK